ncbi:hypothetical protein MP228_001023 [Amoeboaphelidium protococcarum]|nr:hypothetical protein MP228_001023 [Amoeboaphelidium protococcarum]
MATFFDQVTVSFADVPTSNGVEVAKFLAATEDLIKLFDFLNGTAFAPVKSDMNGNVKKIREKYNQDPQQYSTLEAIVKAESSLPKGKVASEGLLWLNRGLDFTSSALRRNVDNPTEELNVSFTKAYEGTLQKHHNFLIRPVFALAMKACPYRTEFYKKLGGDDEAATMAKLKPWLEALEKIVKINNVTLQNVK